MSSNPLISNMSYTSRDFNSIYPELLDLVKKLTYKWDPSISNESDPGVILLKLNAIIADKCNYNIDKNVLECFPLSVTQESNARQLYEQLGYFMHWYRSATTKVSLYWKDFENYTRDSSSYVEIPRFTMVTDYDSEVVYTLLSPEVSELNAVDEYKIYLTGEVTTVNAIQGVAIRYNINGREVIQASDLDSNNRLYFTDFDIAENGIFICNDNNRNSFNYADWKRKDNLVTESLGNTYYTFGVLPGSNTCYIEFPQDAETIFKSGIRVVYIRTLGKNGNIPDRRIEKFYNDITSNLTDSNGDKTSISLNSDLVGISNYIEGQGGSDKESLEDAYRNYKRTIGTFNTLITLRDYINAILNGPQLASNVIVTDRTNDIQCSYKIMSAVNNLPTLVNKVDVHEDTVSLDAYDIKIYALKYASATIDTMYEYNQSFDLLTNDELSTIKLYIEDQKAIPHEVANIRTPEQYSNVYVEVPQVQSQDDLQNFPENYYTKSGDDYIPAEAPYDPSTNYYYKTPDYFRSHYCLFKNIYPIECRITPIRTLEDNEKSEVYDSIQQAIYEKLNSQKIEFGETITPYELEDIITNSDERISSTSILNINLKTYVTYWNGKEFKTIPLEGNSEETPYIYSYINSLYSDVQVTDNFRTLTNSEDLAWGVFLFKYVEAYDSGNWFMSKIVDNEGESSYEQIGNITDYVTFNENLRWFSNGDWFTVEINPIDRIRDEIYVKSVLQGVTPLFVSDNEFDYSVAQEKFSTDYIIDNIYSIETSTSVEVTSSENVITLNDNENIRFSTTNLVDGSKYSTYVKYILVRGTDIPSDTTVELNSGEYLFLFWKETDDYRDPYIYDIYSEGFAVNATFSITAVTTCPSELQTLANSVVNVGSSNNIRMMSSTSIFRAVTDTENNYFNSTTNWLSQSKSIQIKHTNTILLNDTYNCYWVLNSVNDSNEYVLFDDYTNVLAWGSTTAYKTGDKVFVMDGSNKVFYQCRKDCTNIDTSNTEYWRQSPAYDYVLDTGEYLYYESTSGTGLYVLGAGTKIERPDTYIDKWAVKAIRQDKITSGGTSVLENYWFTWREYATMFITERKYVNLGAGATIWFDPGSTPFGNPISIISEKETEIPNYIKIKYTFDTNNPQWTTLSDNVEEWYAKVILGLSVGEHEQQALLKGQSLYLTLLDKTTKLVEGDDPDTDDPDYEYPVVFQSSIPIDTTNASGKTYTYIINEDGSESGNSLYLYKLRKDTDECHYNSNGSATIVFPINDDLSNPPTVIDVPFSVPDVGSNYIISVYNPNDDLLGATLTIDQVIDNIPTALFPINTPFDRNIAASKTYFFDVVMHDNDTLRFTMEGLVNTEPKSIVIDKLYKYKKPDDTTDEEFDRYITLLQSLDYDNQYLYNYEIPSDSDSDTLIKDPLEPISFTNPHHICNRFTLCKFDTNLLNSSIQISSR